MGVRLPVAEARAASFRMVAPALAEGCAAAVVLGVMVWLAAGAWAFYDRQVLPHAPRAVELPPPQPPSVRADDPAEVRRWHEVMARLGEASTYMQSKRFDWARDALNRVVELDPENAEATALLTLMQLEPEPTLTPAEAAERQREIRLVELLGAAGAFAEAGRREEALRLAQEAVALDPASPPAQALLARLSGGR